jgi:hypothetical protein
MDYALNDMLVLRAMSERSSTTGCSSGIPCLPRIASASRSGFDLEGVEEMADALVETVKAARKF